MLPLYLKTYSDYVHLRLSVSRDVRPNNHETTRDANWEWAISRGSTTGSIGFPRCGERRRSYLLFENQEKTKEKSMYIVLYTVI